MRAVCQPDRWADSPFSRTAGSCRRVIRVMITSGQVGESWTCDLMTERRYALVQLDGGPSAPGCAAGVLHDFSERRIHPVCHLCRCRVGSPPPPSGNERGGGASLSRRRSRRFRHLFRGRKEHEASFLHDKGIQEKTRFTVGLDWNGPGPFCGNRNRRLLKTGRQVAFVPWGREARRWAGGRVGW